MQAGEELTGGRTHDPIGRVDGRSVRRGDEWWSAGVASMEAGHGRKTGIDIWRDWVCRVILGDKKQKCSGFSQCVQVCVRPCVYVWRKNLFTL